MYVYSDAECVSSVTRKTSFSDTCGRFIIPQYYLQTSQLLWVQLKKFITLIFRYTELTTGRRQIIQLRWSESK